MADTPDAPPPHNPLDVIGAQLTKITAIIGSVVALNAGLNTCTANRVASYASFHTAVSAEESFWKGLYEEYLTVFQPNMDETQKNPKLFAIASLAEHPIPTFREFGVDDADKRQASDSLQALKDSLKNALSNKDAGSLAVAQLVQTQTFDADEAAKARAANGAVSPAAADAATTQVVTQAAPAGASSGQSQVLSTGKAQGWDVDVFWCQGPGDDARFLTASAVAKTLASQAAGGVSILPGASLGRVRLRPLPLVIQQTRPGYQITGDIIRYDNTPDERAVAQTLAKLISTGPSNTFSLVQGVSNTKWYLSVFACAPAKTVPVQALAAQANAPQVADHAAAAQ